MGEWAADTAESAASHSFMNCLAAPHLYGDFDASHHSEVLRRMLPTQGSEGGGDSGCLRVDLQLPRESLTRTSSVDRTLQVHHRAAVNYSLAAHLVKGLPGSEVCRPLCSRRGCALTRLLDANVHCAMAL